MTRALALAAFVALAAPAQADITPRPSFDDPRVQTVSFEPGEAIRLVTYPDSSLKLVFHQGETITRAVMADGAAFRAAVVGYGDTIEIVPLRADAASALRVETSLRRYEFTLATGEGLAAAFLVRLVPREGEVQAASAPDPDAPITGYRLSGDRVIRPDAIYDDGTRTFLEWADDRTLPAVFGVGPSNNEELVAGYMREGVFVIDRVYDELVFRYDKEKAEAKRQKDRN